MHNSPISKAFYNNIAEVLSGKTTQKVELPQSLVEAAKSARRDLDNAFLEEGYATLERRKEILRRNLKEGATKCGCNLTNQMVARFDEMVDEIADAPVVAEASKDKMPTQNSPLATPSEVAKKTNPPASKGAASAKMPTQSGTLATPAEVTKKTANPSSKSSMGKNAGLAGAGKNPAKIGEDAGAEDADTIVETTEALSDFVNELNEDEIRILKNILSNR